MTWTAIIGTLLLAALVGWQISRAMRMAALAHEGIVRSGTVRQKYRRLFARGDAVPAVRFEFTDDAGVVRRGKGAVGAEAWEEIEAGGSIEVVSLPDRPQQCAPKSEVNRTREALGLPPL